MKSFAALIIFFSQMSFAAELANRHLSAHEADDIYTVFLPQIMVMHCETQVPFRKGLKRTNPLDGSVTYTLIPVSGNPVIIHLVPGEIWARVTTVSCDGGQSLKTLKKAGER